MSNNNVSPTSQLAKLMAAAQASGAEQAQAQAEKAPRKAREKKVDDRNRDLRDVLVTISDTAKVAYITTRFRLSGHAIEFAHNLAVKKYTVAGKTSTTPAEFAALVGAEDVRSYFVDGYHQVSDPMAQVGKFVEHVRLRDLGYNVLSTRGAVPENMVDPADEAAKQRKAEERAAKAAAKSAEEQAALQAAAEKAVEDTAAEASEQATEGAVEGTGEVA